MAKNKYHITATRLRRLAAIMAACLLAMPARAQVSFSARVFYPSGRPVVGIPPLRMLIDSEDTVRHYLGGYDISKGIDTIHFDNIAKGSRCQISCYLIGNTHIYKSDVFTFNADTYIDSLVLMRRDREGYVFWTKAEKDSTLKARAAQWSRDIEAYDTLWYNDEIYYVDGDPCCLKLARLYYMDWVSPFASWRTFAHAADSAYRYCLYTLNRHPSYSFLYYPVMQLARHMNQSPNVKTPKPPDKHTYFPQPEMADGWQNDTTANLFTPWEKHTYDNHYARKYTLGKAYEESLRYPATAADGTMRYMITNPLGGIVIYRVQGGRMYYNRFPFSEKAKGQWSWDRVELTANELDSVAVLVDAMHKAGRPDDESGTYVIDGSTFTLEYIVDGRYHRYTTSSGAEPPQLKALGDLLWRLYRSKKRR